MEPSASPAPQPPSPPDAGARAALLQHFAPEVRAAYERLSSSDDEAAANVIILAVIRDHAPDKNRLAATQLEDSVTLIEDLGFDSMAITEMIFFIEDLLQTSISDDEIRQVLTIGDLRAFVRRKIADRTPGATAAKA